MHLNWLKLVAVLLLLGAFYVSFAVIDLPYAYYQLMNWIVVGAALVTSKQAGEQDMRFLMWAFLLIAVIFNPVAPLFLRADVWQVADVIVAIYFVLSFVFVRVKQQEKGE